MPIVRMEILTAVRLASPETARFRQPDPITELIDEVSLCSGPTGYHPSVFRFGFIFSRSDTAISPICTKVLVFL